MKKLHLPDNLKVHFGGCENLKDAKILSVMGINYCLYTAFPFVEKKIMRQSSLVEVPKFLSQNFNHVIQDSGLFSMLLGKYKGRVEKSFVYKWYDALVEWTLEHGQQVTVVEVDAQSIIGVDETWHLREQMRKDLPNHRIINVFHYEDGLKGLDRLIEYSDYLALGSYMINNRTRTIIDYIKRKKNNIDIHLLGFTDFAHLGKYKLCTSCDSITWLSPRRFGEIENARVSDLDTDKVKRIVGIDRWNEIKGNSSDSIANTMCVSVERWKHKCSKIIGNQDLKWIYNK